MHPFLLKGYILWKCKKIGHPAILDRINITKYVEEKKTKFHPPLYFQIFYAANLIVSIWGLFHSLHYEILIPVVYKSLKVDSQSFSQFAKENETRKKKQWGNLRNAENTLWMFIHFIFLRSHFLRYWAQFGLKLFRNECSTRIYHIKAK